MHPSGIITLSEAAATKKWGSRRTLGKYVKLGLPHRVIGLVTLTTVEHLDAFERPRRGRQIPK